MAYVPTYTTAYKPAYPGTGSPHYPGGGLVAPSGSLLWYDAQDINAGGAQPADGAQLTPWKNKGSLGSAWDVFMAAAGTRPIFRLHADGVKINGLAAVESNGTQYLNSNPALGSLTQPMVLAAVFRATDLAAAGTIFDGGAATTNMAVNAGTGTVAIYSGSNYITQAIPAATWEMCVARFDGASSFNRLNGSQSANGNTGTNASTMASLFNTITVTIFKGMIAELFLFPAASVVVTDIEAYFSSKYGVTPQ